MSGRKQQHSQEEDSMKDVVNRYLQGKDNKTNVNSQSPDYQKDLPANDYHAQFVNPQKTEQTSKSNNPKDIFNSPDFSDIFLKKPYEPNHRKGRSLIDGVEEIPEPKQEFQRPEQPVYQNIPQPEPEPKRQVPFGNVYQQPEPNLINTKQSYFVEEEIAQIKNIQKDFATRPNFRQFNDQFNWRDIDLLMLPLGVFYHPNTRIQIRSVEVREIQHIATLDNESIMEARKKLNDLLNNCIQITLYNGIPGTIEDIKEGDRLYLILYLREITFQEGNMLTVSTECECKRPLKIELVRHHLEYHTISPDIESYWNQQYNCFAFPVTIRNTPVFLAPPSIGLQTSFIEWVQYRKARNLKVNESFYKIVPFTKVNVNNMTIEEIEKELALFENKLSAELFSYLEDAINNYMKFGIKGLVKRCSCGKEVRTNRVFPRRAKDLFLVPSAFSKFTKKHS